jgi:hypothetical protein
MNENFNNNKNSFEIGDVISYRKMVDYILDNNLKSVDGYIDYNEAKDIAAASDNWTLEMVDLSTFDWVVDSDWDNTSMNAYPIVTLIDNKFEVLDGKHRIGMLNDKGYKNYPMWVGRM